MEASPIKYTVIEPVKHELLNPIIDKVELNHNVERKFTYDVDDKIKISITILSLHNGKEIIRTTAVYEISYIPNLEHSERSLLCATILREIYNDLNYFIRSKSEGRVNMRIPPFRIIYKVCLSTSD
ncbi:hypothetical protein M2451_001510 [Dysgonomonas sp. PFB1-18]|uniref:hypothetical protein n=1 Tax=unclassified Dysgonomonas TaxID=2630389 RepID=UPI002476CC63|nr:MULTISPECIES: hypothetical protein [unclassified Dysgonomonas]MDH6309032.1 hypothetical protein [Dysgonomonas sp. PF1-14]MDH6338783.1 hypothetical protein [Dysgonomonas sp. PF1-16]MDH6380189.1 hypothetical protein [Dysgonomonas sp. PFB1-18]MDH6397519.1 hypothetical protein [Dysgonomonas sp. PF1-23]